MKSKKAIMEKYNELRHTNWNSEEEEIELEAQCHILRWILGIEEKVPYKTQKEIREENNII